MNRDALIRPAVVFAAACGFLALFACGYLTAGSDQVWPLLLAAGGVAVLALILLAAVLLAGPACPTPQTKATPPEVPAWALSRGPADHAAARQIEARTGELMVRLRLSRGAATRQALDEAHTRRALTRTDNTTEATA